MFPKSDLGSREAPIRGAYREVSIGLITVS